MLVVQGQRTRPVGFPHKLKLLLTMAMLSWCFAVPAALADEKLIVARPDSSCDIIGTVADMKKVVRSPFSDGTPSTIVIIEMHISVNVQNRRPHNASTATASSCAVNPHNELVTYKLCSSAQPQEGDKIMATEAGSSGTTSAARCLFDLQIMPRTASKNQ